MGLFKKKEEVIFNPVTGQVVPIEEVHDELFSSKALGDGFGILPTQSDIYSPVEGNVVSIFPTKHAISIVTKNGIELLVHMGIDTVELNGQGFDILVEENQKITQNTLLAKMDLEYVKNNQKQTDIMIIFTNLDNKPLTIRYGEMQHGVTIGSI
ncbi:PTS sugar transporter subunit IIA [Enterococcus faecalis]|uniref:PTS sugar transporter subunit IIA n=1 Tax=Enterococcus faecalis TaxID=1351 RepID=UPI000F7FDB76|nr:PTS glucose transporter subunit IIA [Enterococcus faecalis]RTK08458.1 PTS glucose transporter subunit IIA [Enterococcus faecalis]RTK19046.1 PTS glucose transporter subunit IIA [Enterococcus faecalis]RTK81125.1 PTS glucose transporter subunit IIA [Enterococcus faecalis]